MLNLKVVPPRYRHHSPDYTSPDGSRYVTWDSSSLPPLQASAVPRGWELNPKPSTEQYLRRILTSVISLADTFKTWRSQGVTIPFFSSDSATCVHEHFETKHGGDGWSRTSSAEAADLQSTGVTNFPTSPKTI